MGMRGIYNGLFDHKTLNSSWSIRLVQATPIQFSSSFDELGLDGPGHLEGARLRIQEEKERFKQLSDRNFIYFICTRPRLRFARYRAIRLKKGQIAFRFSVGESRWPKTKELPAPSLINLASNTEIPPIGVNHTESCFTVTYANGQKMSSTLFDYFEHHQVDLGLVSNVEYIGQTNHPKDRPLNYKHPGLAKVFQNANRDICEVFCVYNAFHASFRGELGPGVTLMGSNSTSEILNQKHEAEFIESLLIDYFKPEAQCKTTPKDRTRLENLEAILRKNSVQGVNLEYQVETQSDLYRLGSSTIRPSKRHKVHRPLN